MAIQIGGTTVISDDFNIENVNDMRVGLITFFGSSGNIDTPGTISAAGIDIPPSVVSFSPADGSTDVNIDTNIVLTFNLQLEKQTTGIGTTANITLRNSSGIGTILETIGVSSTSVEVSGAVVTINRTGLPYLPNSTDVYVVVDANAFTVVNTVSSNELIDTYNFSTGALELGGAYEGGYLICCASPTRWIVAPSTSEVSRNWHNRNDANTTAQSVSGCTGWFVPTCAQLQNPGYTCRTFWDSFSPSTYWSSTEGNSVTAYRLDFNTGTVSTGDYNSKNNTLCVRAFRCVTY